MSCAVFASLYTCNLCCQVYCSLTLLVCCLQFATATSTWKPPAATKASSAPVHSLPSQKAAHIHPVLSHVPPIACSACQCWTLVCQAV